MSEPTPIYIVKQTAVPDELPTWITKMAYRLLQVAKQPGEYQMLLTVHPDGLKELTVIPPPKAERLGY